MANPYSAHGGNDQGTIAWIATAEFEQATQLCRLEGTGFDLKRPCVPTPVNNPIHLKGLLAPIADPLARMPGPGQARIPAQHRSSFTISSEGSYLHWPEGDVHIDLDAVRCLKDDAWREKKERERLLYDMRFGEAVAALRKQRGIKQAEIQGLSERQVRRIERGERTKIDTLAIVARSHGLSLKEYLNEIAEMLAVGD